MELERKLWSVIDPFGGATGQQWHGVSIEVKDGHVELYDSNTQENLPLHLRVPYVKAIIRLKEGYSILHTVEAHSGFSTT